MRHHGPHGSELARADQAAAAPGTSPTAAADRRPKAASACDGRRRSAPGSPTASAPAASRTTRGSRARETPTPARNEAASAYRQWPHRSPDSETRSSNRGQITASGADPFSSATAHARRCQTGHDPLRPSARIRSQCNRPIRPQPAIGESREAAAVECRAFRSQTLAGTIRTIRASQAPARGEGRGIRTRGATSHGSRSMRSIDARCPRHPAAHRTFVRRLRRTLRDAIFRTSGFRRSPVGQPVGPSDRAARSPGLVAEQAETNDRSSDRQAG